VVNQSKLGDPSGDSSIQSVDEFEIEANDPICKLLIQHLENFRAMKLND